MLRNRNLLSVLVILLSASTLLCGCPSPNPGGTADMDVSQIHHIQVVAHLTFDTGTPITDPAVITWPVTVQADSNSSVTSDLTLQTSAGFTINAGVGNGTFEWNGSPDFSFSKLISWKDPHINVSNNLFSTDGTIENVSVAGDTATIDARFVIAGLAQRELAPTSIGERLRSALARVLPARGGSELNRANARATKPPTPSEAISLQKEEPRVHRVDRAS
ncbi:MAG: hypothetical protein ACXWP5_11265 [Bdellovibrionota bacterium]